MWKLIQIPSICSKDVCRENPHVMTFLMTSLSNKKLSSHPMLLLKIADIRKINRLSKQIAIKKQKKHEKTVKRISKEGKPDIGALQKAKDIIGSLSYIAAIFSINILEELTKSSKQWKNSFKREKLNNVEVIIKKWRKNMVISSTF